MLAVLVLPLLMVIGLLIVDVGQVRLAETQLQAAVDAAARHAAVGLRDYGAADARTRAAVALADNGFDTHLDGVSFGLWDPANRNLIPLTGTVAENGATAVCVTASFSPARGDGVNTFFGSMLGYGDRQITVSATAAIGEPVEIEIDAKASPYLAGLSSGDGLAFTGYTDLDWAPTHSYWDDCKPSQVSISLRPGQMLYFRDVQGSTGDYQSGLTYGLEGNLGRTNVAQAAGYGINTTKAPLNSLMGIFLDDRRPDEWAMQDKLDYTGTAHREARQHDPLTKQVFFIGDGVSNDDGRLQRFVVPEGATRLFLGLNDESGFWWDNFGEYRTTLFTGDIRIVE